MKELKLFGALIVGLFVVLIIVGITFIGSLQMQETTCTTLDTDNVWEGGSCLNETGGTAVTSDALTQQENIVDVMIVALSLLTLVILVLIFAVIIKVARGFGKGTE